MHPKKLVISRFLFCFVILEETVQNLGVITPLCETDGLLGAIQHPDDGYIQPADLTQAFAKGARNRGAEIYRNTTVIGSGSNELQVNTDGGVLQFQAQDHQALRAALKPTLSRASKRRVWARAWFGSTLRASPTTPRRAFGTSLACQCHRPIRGGGRWGRRSKCS